MSEEEPIRLRKFTVRLSISEATRRRLEEELPAMRESWLELKRDLLQWEADKIGALLTKKPASDE